MNIGDFNSKEEIEKALRQIEEYEKQQEKLAEELSHYGVNSLIEENYHADVDAMEANEKFKNK
jgi:phage host-nuclease inhibitor protein Gam